MHETISTTRARTPPRRMTQQTKAARQPRTPSRKKPQLNTGARQIQASTEGTQRPNPRCHEHGVQEHSQ
jgi:hypothetical protein